MSDFEVVSKPPKKRSRPSSHDWTKVASALRELEVGQALRFAHNGQPKSFASNCRVALRWHGLRVTCVSDDEFVYVSVAGAAQ